MLTPNGKLVVTLPIGFNPYMDKLIKEGKISFTELYCMKKISHLWNKWKQVEWDNIKDLKYGYPYPRTNGLIIGVIKKVQKKESKEF